MEKPLRFYEHVYSSSSRIDLSTYFEKYATLKKRYYTNDTPKEQKPILESMGVKVEEEDFNMLKDYCDIDNLTIPGEVEVCSNYRSWHKELLDGSSIPDDVPLQTLKELRKGAQYTKPTKRATKYRSEISVRHEIDKNTSGPLAVPGQDILVYIRIYAPFKHRNHNKNSAQLVKVCLNTVVSILGSQTLADLRSKISCISDLSIATEISKKPVLKPAPSAKEIYKSGFFYIEGTFYNDMRDQANKDYSLVIREWASARNIGPFETSLMETTRIDSLNVRFGFPWVYQHQGNCEHLIVFSDAKLLNSNEDLSVISYPKIHRIKPHINKYCMTCGINCVRWITTNNDRLPHDPCFFCETCFKSYNYISGKKIGTFSAYPYPFHAELMEKTPNSDKTNNKEK